MGKNKQLRIRLHGLRETIRIHVGKIDRELSRPVPDMGLIRHWKVEVLAWEKSVARLETRLKKGSRHA